MDSFALSDKGMVRANNEDYCRVIPELGLYLLADGMGGAKGGETASRMAVDTVTEIVAAADVRDTAVLLQAFEEANARVLGAASRDSKLEGMGTTLVAALATAPNEMAVVSVGDSRAYLYANDTLTPVTEDQTWVREVGIPLGLDAAAIKSHPMRHVLTMAIGVSATLVKRCYAVAMETGAILLLCSDGLHGVVDAAEIVNILGENSSAEGTLELKCKKLIEAARTAGGPDNISVVLVQA